MSTQPHWQGTTAYTAPAGVSTAPEGYGRAPARGLTLLAAVTLALVGALSLSLGVARASQTRPASSTISILSETQTFRYPSSMTFHLQASDSSGSISSAHLIIDVPPEQIHHDIAVPVDRPGAQITLTYTYDATNDYLPPFTPITYHWVLGDGNQQNTLTGANQQFDFEDTRFTWSHLSQNDITVYWYKLGSSFGQQLLNTAVSEATSIEQDLQGTLTTPIRIFAYQSNQDLRGGLPPNTPDWAGGVALVELHQALIVVGESEGHPLQRDLPHELTHLIFHQIAGLGCGGCPLWFDEGMAVYHQLYHEPDMQALFDGTVRNNRLLPLSTLTERFPSDSTLAELAYAQSWKFVAYLYQQFGEPKVAKLVNSLNTTSFDTAFPATFGGDVPHVESQWHVSLGLPPTLNTSPNATPATGNGSPNPAPITPGNSDQLVALGVLLVTLLLMGLLVGGYLRWRKGQVPAPLPGGAPLPPGPAAQTPGMEPPSGFQPGYHPGWTQSGLTPAAAGIPPAQERLIQVRQSILALLAQEKQLQAQQAQLQARLARWDTQGQNTPAASGLQGQRYQLQNYLNSIQQQLAQVRLQKQRQHQIEQQLAAFSQGQAWPGAEASPWPGTQAAPGPGYTGAGWPPPGQGQPVSRQRISQE